MSAYVCTNNRTYSCIIELAMRQETIINPNLLAQRLYLLNVESVNQRYQLRDSKSEESRKEYKEYFEHLANIRFEPQPDLHDAQRIRAAHCWMYQSCEGDCDQDPLFKAVRKITLHAEICGARTHTGRAEFVVISAANFFILWRYGKFMVMARVDLSNRQRPLQNLVETKNPSGCFATSWILVFYNGANDRNRTDDLFITSELLYRLSYIGLTSCHNIAE